MKGLLKLLILSTYVKDFHIFIYLSSIASKLAICVGLKVERKYRKGVMQRIDSFNPPYLRSIASRLAICMCIKMKKLYMIGGIAMIVLLLSIAIINYSLTKEENNMTYNDFLSYADNGLVEEVTFLNEDNYILVKLKNDTISYKVPNPKSDNFTEYLLLQDISISYTDTSQASPFLQIILIGAIAGAVIIIRKRQKSGGLIHDANHNNKSEALLTLQDIAGNIEAKAMVDDIIQFIKHPDKYAEVGAKMPRGILFYGPPGTGKTLMAKAIAGEAQVPFYPMSGSDFIQMYVGVGASRIRDLFKKAKKAEKAVIFIDEIDAIGKKRGRNPNSSNDERDQTLNALLTEMSGFQEREGIVVIAATNRLDTLDEALTRPGRFDRLIEIGLPDINARKKILELHAKNKPVSDNVDFEELARATVYFSGAMLENLLNESAILAANEHSKVISIEHIDKAFYTVIAGAQKTDRSYITKEDRKITAYHETGHALMTHLLLPDSYISKVTIIPSVQGAGGFSLSIPKDTLYMTKHKIIANIKVLLAGRASEELIFGIENITTGASNDIEKVSNLMMDYINKYGMDEKFGLFHTSTVDSIPSNELLELCRANINVLYEETKQQLEANMDMLHKIAKELLQKETLNQNDIERLCAVA